MGARFLFDLVDPAVLTQYIRTYDQEVLRNQMVLSQWLPPLLNDELEYRINRRAFKDVDAAQFRAFDTQPGMTGRQGFDRIRGELVPLSRQIPLTEEERLRLKAIGNSQGGAAMIDAIYADAELMIRAVQVRLELARGQVLTTGTFALAENGLNMTADFGMPNSHKPTAAATWANVATDILSDLLAWMQLYVDDNGFEPGAIVTSRTALGYMLNNTAMKNAAAFAGSTPARLNLETIAAIFAANGLPPVVVYDSQFRVGGVQTRAIPSDKVLFLPPTGNPLGATHYGVTAEAMVLNDQGYIAAEEMPGIVAVNLRNDNPVQTFTLATAIAIPVLGDPVAVICADIIP